MNPAADDAAPAPPAPRARRMSRDQRREQLLDTALRVFSDGGYHATSMDEIAAAAEAGGYSIDPVRPTVDMLAGKSSD